MNFSLRRAALAAWFRHLLTPRQVRARARKRAVALLKLADMGSPTESAKFLRLEGGMFIYGVPPSIDNLTLVERVSLLELGEGAHISYREMRVSPETVFKRAKLHAVKTGEPMPSKTELTLGV